jgi:hypothetical protein
MEQVNTFCAARKRYAKSRVPYGCPAFQGNPGKSFE